MANLNQLLAEILQCYKVENSLLYSVIKKLVNFSKCFGAASLHAQQKILSKNTQRD